MCLLRHLLVAAVQVDKLTVLLEKQMQRAPRWIERRAVWRRSSTTA